MDKFAKAAIAVAVGSSFNAVSEALTASVASVCEPVGLSA